MVDEKANVGRSKLEQQRIKEAVSPGQGSAGGTQAQQPGIGMPDAPQPGQAPVPGQASESMQIPGAPVQPQGMQYVAQAPKGGYEGMEPSMLGPSQGQGQQMQQLEQQPQEDYQAASPGQALPQGGYQTAQPEQQQGSPEQQQYGAQDPGAAYPAEGYMTGYEQYQPYQEAMSSDVITEISEQVVGEKLSILHDKLEEATGFKTIADARLNGLDERLKRIEKIIDRLQLSLLQKMGDYVADVNDLRTELVETQKSFGKLSGKKVASSGKQESGKRGIP